MATKRTSGTLHLMTVKHVQAASDGDHSDGGGLLLRIRSARESKSSGKPLAATQSWVFRYTSPAGQRREMGLGIVVRGSPKQAGDSLTGARAQAHAARELLRQGVDPIDRRDAGRATQLQTVLAKKAEKARAHWTLCRVAREYHERVIEPTRTTLHAKHWIASLENHMPKVVWNAPIDSITAPALLEALAQVRSLEVEGQGVPETLKRIRQRLDAVFEDAIFHGRCASNPAAAVRRKMRETMPRKEAGQFAALPYKEAPAFMKRLRDAQGTAARCLEFAVLTAARTSEVLGAVWSEFDLEEGTWLVPAERMKASGKDRAESHSVHLSARALTVLKGQIGAHPEIVFPSTMLKDKPQSNMAMLTVLDRMGERKRTTVHGLCRATFSTWAYDTAAARPDVIEACLAHREADKVKAAYNRAQFTAERKELLAAWAEYLALPPAQVIQLEHAA
jgi:integrase